MFRSKYWSLQEIAKVCHLTEEDLMRHAIEGRLQCVVLEDEKPSSFVAHEKVLDFFAAQGLHPGLVHDL